LWKKVTLSPRIIPVLNYVIKYCAVKAHGGVDALTYLAKKRKKKKKITLL
jgi:hypothetical protein